MLKNNLLCDNQQPSPDEGKVQRLGFIRRCQVASKHIAS